jgi:general secretion pathway protein K
MMGRKDRRKSILAEDEGRLGAGPKGGRAGGGFLCGREGCRGRLTAVGGQEGFALIIILWIAVFISVMALDFASNMRLEARISRNYLDGGRAYFLALSGFDLAVAEFQRRDDYVKESKTESLSDLQKEKKELWAFDGTDNVVEVDGDRITLQLFAEDGKIDLNKTHATVVRNFLELAGLESEDRNVLADSIEDWRDEDNLHRMNGAEDDYYEKLEPPYEARNGDFESVEELLLVRGMTEELMYRDLAREGDMPKLESDSESKSRKKSSSVRFADCLTVYNTTGKINLNSAPKEVLLSIPFMTPGLVSRILELRDTRGAEFLDADDYRRALGDDVFNAVQEYASLGEMGKRFTIRSRGMTDNGATQEILAVVEFNSGSKDEPYVVLRWVDAAF